MEEPPHFLHFFLTSPPLFLFADFYPSFLHHQRVQLPAGRVISKWGWDKERVCLRLLKSSRYFRVNQLKDNPPFANGWFSLCSILKIVIFYPLQEEFAFGLGTVLGPLMPCATLCYWHPCPASLDSHSSALMNVVHSPLTCFCFDIMRAGHTIMKLLFDVWMKKQKWC